MLRRIRRQARSDLLRIPRTRRSSRVPTRSPGIGGTDSELGAVIFTSVKNTTYMSTKTPRMMNSRKMPRNRKMARSKGFVLFLLSRSLSMDHCDGTRRYSCGHPRQFAFFLHEISGKNWPHFFTNKQMQNNMGSVQSVCVSNKVVDPVHNLPAVRITRGNELQLHHRIYFAQTLHTYCFPPRALRPRSSSHQ